MASLHRNNTSPFWWLKWRNPATGKTERFSTGKRIGDQAEYIHAIALRNQYAVKETAHRINQRDHPFVDWVEDYLNATHGNSPKTLVRYLSTWRVLAAYLASKEIITPAQVQREHCLSYLNWRRTVPHLNSKRNKKLVCRNTMIVEIKVLSKILQEAVNRHYIPYNPALRLGLKKDPHRIKDEIDNRQAKIILEEIRRRLNNATTDEEKANAIFLQRSFEIASKQGIRLSETWIDLNNVDLHRLTLRVIGKGRKVEEINLNPDLLPLFTQLKSDRATHTYPRPRMASLVWFKLFDRLRKTHPDLRNVSFHSTRVTAISRLERSGAPEPVTMKTVLHASTTIHRGYRRVKREEISPYWSALRFDEDKNPST